MFYLLTYGLMTLGAFAVLTLVRDGDGEATHLSQWAGLASAVAADGGGDDPVPARRWPASR